MPKPLVLRGDDGPIARLTLNDPDRANVLSRAMMTELADALSKAAGDDRVRVVVLDAAGRVFCAGHDLGSCGPMRISAPMRPCSPNARR